jgi:hypothetical protein
LSRAEYRRKSQTNSGKNVGWDEGLDLCAFLQMVFMGAGRERMARACLCIPLLAAHRHATSRLGGINRFVRIQRKLIQAPVDRAYLLCRVRSGASVSHTKNVLEPFSFGMERSLPRRSCLRCSHLHPLWVKYNGGYWRVVAGSQVVSCREKNLPVRNRVQ